MRCLEAVKVLEVLRLREMGFSQRDIGSSINCGKSTVGDVLRRCQEVGLTYEAAEKMTNEEIKVLLYPSKTQYSASRTEPDWAQVHAELHETDIRGRTTRVNLQYLWEKYRQDCPGGLGYSQYCRKYLAWKDSVGINVSMPINREPGKEMMVDWCGDTLDCVIDSETGELLKAHFFVSTLGYSYYPYVEAFPDEKNDKWLAAHVNALKYYGGLPRVITPDNTKNAVTKSNYYDPAINAAYLDLARHYGMAVIPARVRKPKDKSPVEGSIGWLEVWLLEWLRHQTFYSFRELNAAIKDRIGELARRPFKKRPGSRESDFRTIDKPALRPLPSTHYEAAEFITRRVPQNYHVEYGGFYYSVPYTLYKQKVTMRITTSVIEILNESRQRVALHVRRYTGSRYDTDIGHMPARHRHQLELGAYDGARYREWAGSFGESTYAVIDRLLCAQATEEQAYRSCMGLLQMGKKAGSERLEAACRKALDMHSVTYTTVKNILQNHQESVPAAKTSRATPPHSNLRGNVWE
ncbi:MAG: IS21 family transposase [Planctomycetes bacterium]|jgi:transposase|nr:IS21 family transposase [Planctomycetota bacterium]